MLAQEVETSKQCGGCLSHTFMTRLHIYCSSSCDSPTRQQIDVTKTMKRVGKNPGLQTRLRMQSKDQKLLIHTLHQKEAAKVVRITWTDNKQMESLVFDEHGTLAEAMEVPSYK